MADIETFRTETRSWLEANAPQSLIGYGAGDLDSYTWGGRRATFATPDHKVWMDVMGKKQWTAPMWPKEYGGGGLNKAEAKVLREEMQRRGRKSGKAILRDEAKYQISSTGLDALAYRRTVAVARLEKKLLGLLKQGKRLDFTTYFDKLNENKRKRKSRVGRRGVFEELYISDKKTRGTKEFAALKRTIYRDRARYKKTLANVATGSFP